MFCAVLNSQATCERQRGGRGKAVAALFGVSDAMLVRVRAASAATQRVVEKHGAREISLVA